MIIIQQLKENGILFSFNFLPLCRDVDTLITQDRFNIVLDVRYVTATSYRGDDMSDA